MNRHTLLFFLLAIASASCSTTATKPNPTAAAEYNANLGARYLSKGHTRLANEKLLKALEQNPDLASANHYYALLLQSLKQNKKAEKHFKRALREDTDNSEIHNNYGSFLCGQKKYAAAEKHFLKAISDPLYTTPAFAYTNAGVCAHDAGNDTKAEDYLRTALKKQTNLPSALYAMAKLSYDNRKYSRAQSYLFRYNAATKESAKSLSLCKQIHIQLGEIKKADQCTNKLLQLFPNSKEALQSQ